MGYTIDRGKKLRKFTLEEMRNVIANGSDDRLNTLVLDVEGNFDLMDFDDVRDNPRIAVRNETFCPGNDYVGLEASKDEEFIKATYLGMLEGWLTHLTTGRGEVFVDYYSQISEREAWAMVDSILGAQ